VYVVEDNDDVREQEVKGRPVLMGWHPSLTLVLVSFEKDLIFLWISHPTVSC
jgi:hypothetical protein